MLTYQAIKRTTTCLSRIRHCVILICNIHSKRRQCGMITSEFKWLCFFVVLFSWYLLPVSGRLLYCLIYFLFKKLVWLLYTCTCIPVVVRCRKNLLKPVVHLLIPLIFFSGPNQVDTFLTEHGGPGIQHIGLHTSNITEAVATLKDNGVAFIDPPSTYYSEVCYD